jgi:hypothetical protein
MFCVLTALIASLALVTDASTIFDVVTELSASLFVLIALSAIFVLVIARFATVGFG